MFDQPLLMTIDRRRRARRKLPWRRFSRSSSLLALLSMVNNSNNKNNNYNKEVEQDMPVSPSLLSYVRS